MDLRKNGEYMSIPKFAKYIGVSYTAIKFWIANEGFPVEDHPVKKQLQVNLRNAQRWLENRKKQKALRWLKRKDT